MGQYLVNGEVVDVRQSPPTAAGLKRQLGSPSSDWVMASMPGGQVVKLNDQEALPAQAENLSIVPAYEYGNRFSPAALLRSRLAAEAQLLARRYGEAAYDQQDGSWLHIARFPLPSGWNKSIVEILIDIPCGVPGYPSVAPQWFWTDRDLRTREGRAIDHFF